MTNKTIIIDAAHREETRVAVLDNGILQDFDREALAVKQLKGNIYLAKITRVEPSLQAAFIDYGEDRHGFLPFADIHPEYFNLPEAEKQKLHELLTAHDASNSAAAAAADVAAEADSEEAEIDTTNSRSNLRNEGDNGAELRSRSVDGDAGNDDRDDRASENRRDDRRPSRDGEARSSRDGESRGRDGDRDSRSGREGGGRDDRRSRGGRVRDDRGRDGGRGRDGRDGQERDSRNGEFRGENRGRDDRNNPREREEDEPTITTGSYSVEDETDSYSGNIHSIYKRYNIQDVIKPGQTFLIQVTKEERGNKGASMTTYISLAGKYCVLMSNTPNKGGVSRKVDNFRDRKILKAILGELAIPVDRSVIIRTAGVGKKPEEIKRDYEYLNRLWESIREMSKTSTAPTFVHAEDDVIKRCLRDVYNEQVAEVIVEGQQAFDTVSNFIKATMPFSQHNIIFHDDRVPVFNKYRVEQQISALYEKNIPLKSGGSIVVDHTEALVAIDVNSGRATKESGIEETAYQTNLEAAREIARQLRLRDLAGLVVIDFIDMYDQKHRRAIERTLRDELQNDRARIQLGRISLFGLMEMSRQRLGASLFETITEPCKHCEGTGYIRSVEILAVGILRSIRYACADKQVGVIYVYTSPEVISYLANYKKHDIIATEKNYNVHIFMHHSDDVGSGGFTIKKRKGLSDEERRELEMEVTTGKVNQLGLEREFIDSDATVMDRPIAERTGAGFDRPNRDEFNSSNGPRDNRHGGDRNNNRNRNNNNRFNNNKKYRGNGNNDRRRFDDRGGQPSSGGGLLGSIFKMFK